MIQSILDEPVKWILITVGVSCQKPKYTDYSKNFSMYQNVQNPDKEKCAELFWLIDRIHLFSLDRQHSVDQTNTDFHGLPFFDATEKAADFCFYLQSVLDLG